MQQIIEKDIKVALLAGDRLKVEVLKGLKSSIQNQRIASGKDLDDDEIIKLVKKETKKRHEAASLYEQAGAGERKEKELKEADILAKYLPEQLTEQELSKVVDNVIEDNKIDSPQKLGMLIGLVNKQVGAGADGARIAKIAKEKLGI